MTSPALLWREVEDVLGIPGWSLHVGYTVTKEPGDAPDVSIWAATLETGNQTFQLNRQSLPNVGQLEAIVSEQIEGEDLQTAFDLAHPRTYDDTFDMLASVNHALSALR